MSARPRTPDEPGRAVLAGGVVALMVLVSGCAAPRSPASASAPAAARPPQWLAQGPAAADLRCALCDRDLSEVRTRIGSFAGDDELRYFCNADHREQYIAGLRTPRAEIECVVCLRPLAEDDPERRPVQQGGQTYHLCSAACAEQFQHDPALFIPPDEPGP